MLRASSCARIDEATSAGVAISTPSRKMPSPTLVKRSDALLASRLRAHVLPSFRPSLSPARQEMGASRPVASPTMKITISPGDMSGHLPFRGAEDVGTELIRLHGTIGGVFDCSAVLARNFVTEPVIDVPGANLSTDSTSQFALRAASLDCLLKRGHLCSMQDFLWNLVQTILHSKHAKLLA